MRVVLDTNVIVSGILSPTGAARALLDLARAGHLELVTSPILLEEIEDVLTRFFPRAAASEIRVAIEEIAYVVDPLAVPAITRDPDDDHVLAAVSAGNASCVVTRDADLRVLGQYHGIRILEPAPALHVIREEREDSRNPG